MGQKGKFLSHRAGYSLIWDDIWYSHRQYHSIYFQNILIRDFFYFLLTTGFTSTNFFINFTPKVSNMFTILANFKNSYHYLLKNVTYSSTYIKHFIRPIKGIYLTRLHILKIFNFIIIYVTGYKWRKKKKKKMYRVEKRLNFVIQALILLDTNTGKKLLNNIWKV